MHLHATKLGQRGESGIRFQIFISFVAILVSAASLIMSRHTYTTMLVGTNKTVTQSQTKVVIPPLAAQKIPNEKPASYFFSKLIPSFISKLVAKIDYKAIPKMTAEPEIEKPKMIPPPTELANEEVKNPPAVPTIARPVTRPVRKKKLVSAPSPEPQSKPVSQKVVSVPHRSGKLLAASKPRPHPKSLAIRSSYVYRPSFQAPLNSLTTDPLPELGTFPETFPEGFKVK